MLYTIRARSIKPTYAAQIVSARQQTRSDKELISDLFLFFGLDRIFHIRSALTCRQLFVLTNSQLSESIGPCTPRVFYLSFISSSLTAVFSAPSELRNGVEETSGANFRLRNWYVSALVVFPAYQAREKFSKYVRNRSVVVFSQHLSHRVLLLGKGTQRASGSSHRYRRQRTLLQVFGLRPLELWIIRCTERLPFIPSRLNLVVIIS